MNAVSLNSILLSFKRLDTFLEAEMHQHTDSAYMTLDLLLVLTFFITMPFVFALIWHVKGGRAALVSSDHASLLFSSLIAPCSMESEVLHSCRESRLEVLLEPWHLAKARPTKTRRRKLTQA